MDFKNCRNIPEFILVLEKKKSTIYVKDLHVYFVKRKIYKAPNFITGSPGNSTPAAIKVQETEATQI